MSNWFSNFKLFDNPLIENGISYPTVEHYYQAHKSMDRDKREHIASLATAAMAKKAGRLLEMRPDWDEVKNEVMGNALRYKFAPTTSWGLRLRKTTGEIVEYNYWHDTYWGVCTCNRCHSTGKNMLGVMLMNIRARNIEKERTADCS